MLDVNIERKLKELGGIYDLFQAEVQRASSKRNERYRNRNYRECRDMKQARNDEHICFAPQEYIASPDSGVSKVSSLQQALGATSRFSVRGKCLHFLNYNSLAFYEYFAISVFLLLYFIFSYIQYLLISHSGIFKVLPSLYFPCICELNKNLHSFFWKEFVEMVETSSLLRNRLFSNITPLIPREIFPC